LSTPRRSEKISLRLLIGINVGLKRRRNFCAAWLQPLVVSLVRVLLYTCSFLPAARRGSRCLMRHAPRFVGVPRVVGVDDFAWTKGRRYGTILVDLETHRLIALLADCEEETVATWFRQHPDVQIVTRDRSPHVRRCDSTWSSPSAPHC